MEERGITMSLRDIIKSHIESYAEDKGINLTAEQIYQAANGVEYYISEAMAESVEIAVNNVKD